MKYTTINADDETIQKIDNMRAELEKELGFKVSRLDLINHALTALSDCREG